MAQINSAIGKAANGKSGFATITKAALGFAAAGVLLAAGIGAGLKTTSPAVAATADTVAPLTISRKPPTDLSAAPGIRLAKFASNDGGICFRASRSLPGNGGTISESFCTH